MAKQKWPELVTAFRQDGRDWARKILTRENNGESFSITVIDMAKRALGLQLGSEA